MLAEDHLKRILHELYKVYISDAKKRRLERYGGKILTNKNTNILCRSLPLKKCRWIYNAATLIITRKETEQKLKI